MFSDLINILITDSKLELKIVNYETEIIHFNYKNQLFRIDFDREESILRLLLWNELEEDWTLYKNFETDTELIKFLKEHRLMNEDYINNKKEYNE